MEILYESNAVAALKDMPATDAKRLREAIRQVAERHPERLSFSTEMSGMSGFWRARKGDWRAISRITGNVLTVVKVGHRKDVYE